MGTLNDRNNTRLWIEILEDRTLLSVTAGAIFTAETVGMAAPIKDPPVTITTNDNNDPPIIVSIADGSGEGSLPHAIANAANGGTITFDPNLDGQIINITTRLGIEKNLTIDASNLEHGITIQGNASKSNPYPIITDNGYSINLTLRNITITGGNYATGGGINQLGNGKFTIIDCTITGNKSEQTTNGTSQATDAQGGGIYVKSGTMILAGCTVTNNSTHLYRAPTTGTYTIGGGGISAAGGANLYLISSKVTNNTIGETTSVSYTIVNYRGAGINLDGKSSLYIYQSLISGNKIYGRSTATAEEPAGNTATLAGSGICIGTNCQAKIYLTTIADNQIKNYRNTGYTYGAGIYSISSGNDNVKLYNSIICCNTSANGKKYGAQLYAASANYSAMITTYNTVLENGTRDLYGWNDGEDNTTITSSPFITDTYQLSNESGIINQSNLTEITSLNGLSESLAEIGCTPEILANDLAGNPRKCGSSIEPGAYEHLEKSTISIEANQTVTYNGEVHKAVTVTGTSGTLTYKLNGTTACENEFKDAGTYHIYVYEDDIEIGNAVFTITPKELSVSITAEDKPFDGTAAASVSQYSLEGLCQGDLIENAEFSLEFENTGIGKHSVLLKLWNLNNSNYTISVDNSTVNGAEIMASVTNLSDDHDTAGSLRYAVNTAIQNGGSKVYIDKAYITGYNQTDNIGIIILNSTLQLNGISLVTSEDTHITLNGSLLTESSILTISGQQKVTINNFSITRKGENNTVVKSKVSAVILDAGSNLEMVDCSFFLIDSESSGAAVTVRSGAEFHLSGTLENKSSFIQNNSDSRAGAVMNDGGTIRLENVLFENNTAGKQGGAIANRFGSLIFFNVNFTKNNISLTNNGGAILNDGTAEMTGGSFTYNSCINTGIGGNGGAVNNVGGTFTFHEVLFSNNSSGKTDYTLHSDKSIPFDSGGAIRVVNSTVNLFHCTFSHNTAYNGGAVSVAATGILNVNNCQFTENTAVFGGAISNFGTTNIDCDSSNENCDQKLTNFTLNKSVGHSENNLKHGNGGAINNSSSGILTIANAQFSQNSAADDSCLSGGSGGAIENWGTAAISYSTFSQNNASNGGAIANGRLTEDSSYGILSLVACTLTDNKAEYGGGFLNTGYAEITNLTAVRNTALKNGGAISNTKATVSLDNSAEVLLSYGSIIFKGTLNTIGGSEENANSCDQTNGYGGGILTIAGTTFTIEDNARVIATHNKSCPNHGTDFAADKAFINVAFETADPNFIVDESCIIPRDPSSSETGLPLPTAENQNESHKSQSNTYKTIDDIFASDDLTAEFL